MIVLHSLRGEEFALNGELIERVEGDTETHVTLVTGTSYVVQESTAEVVRLHQVDRAEVQVLAGQVRTATFGEEEAPQRHNTPLRLIEPREHEGGEAT